MSVDVGIKCNQNVAGVSSKGSLYITPIAGDVLPTGTDNRLRLFSSKLGSTGTDSGTTNQNTNGGTYYINSASDYDIFITKIVVIIADTAVAHNTFGGVAALSSGWDLYLTEAGQTTYIIEKAKTGGQVIAQAGLPGGYGDADTTWKLTKWTGTEDATALSIPVGEYVPGGIRIGRGTTDRLVSTFTDDLTGLTEFSVIAIGYSHHE